MPLDVTDLAGEDIKILEYKVKKQNDIIVKQNREIASLYSEIDDLKSKEESLNKPYQDKDKLGKTKSNSAHQADEPKQPTYKQRRDEKKKEEEAWLSL